MFVENTTLSTQPARKVELVAMSGGGVVIISYSTAPAQLYSVTNTTSGMPEATPISVRNSCGMVTMVIFYKTIPNY